MINQVIPEVKTRVRDENSIDITNGKIKLPLIIFKKNILFSLPGAFTPTCSTYQLPDFEALHDFFQEILCVSVNDAFVMNKVRI